MKNLSRDQALARLDELKELEFDWDSYRSKPMTPVALEGARRFVELFPDHIAWISPCPAGGVDIDVAGDGFTFAVEIGPEGENWIGLAICE